MIIVSEKYLKKLVGRTDLEDALKRLDKLTQEEARMAAAQLLKITHNIENKVTQIIDGKWGALNWLLTHSLSLYVARWEGSESDGKGFQGYHAANSEQRRRCQVFVIPSYYLVHLIRKPKLRLVTQVRQELRGWVSPPDPATNHNIACGASHKQMAGWFFEGSQVREWKSAGSLLWIHGKRTLFLPPIAGISLRCRLFVSGSWQEHTLVRWSQTSFKS